MNPGESVDENGPWTQGNKYIHIHRFNLHPDHKVPQQMHYYVFYLWVILFTDMLHRILEQNLMSNLMSGYNTHSEDKSM